eukprot:720571-Prymnesium_polylepis.1
MFRNYGWFRRPVPSRCELTPTATPREVFTADLAAGGRAGTLAVASQAVRARPDRFWHVATFWFWYGLVLVLVWFWLGHDERVADGRWWRPG